MRQESASPFLRRDEKRAVYHHDDRVRQRQLRDKHQAAMTLERLRYNTYVKRHSLTRIMQTIGNDWRQQGYSWWAMWIAYTLFAMRMFRW